jgi:hypothetical protein
MQCTVKYMYVYNLPDERHFKRFDILINKPRISKTIHT